ncbi:MAG: NAD-binding protein [Microthrixaceae bacterium]
MKSLALILTSIIQPLRRRNTRVVLWLVVGLLVMVAVYSTIFHEIMASEGRSYSWATGIYWTLTVMSTLGFGDITFESDIGRIFSVFVLISGAMFILVLLPFVFIQFIFMPWMAHRDANRAPRKLGPEYRDHLILTQLGPVTDALVRRLRSMQMRYTLIVADPAEALGLSDLGYNVMVGNLDDPATYAAARAEQAALVVATQSDMTNANIVFTVREMAPGVPTVATASSPVSLDVLYRAGCDTVLRLGELLGLAMSRRVLGNDARTRVIGSFDDLLVAEASATGTALAGKSVREANLRQLCQVNIAGIWQRGEFELPGPDTVIDDSDVLILVGSEAQLRAYDELFGKEHVEPSSAIVVGGGRVGRAAARTLGEAGVKCPIIEKLPERIRDSAGYVLGDAADLDVLEQAGIAEASSMLITTHDDDFNVYLTIYCRQIRPDIQIIARSNKERNVATLNRAGADSVLSYASLGATAILNTLGDNDSLVLAEGLEMFSTPMPASLAGRSLAQARVREHTGCNVVAVSHGGQTVPNPDPRVPIPSDASLVVIGDAQAQLEFLERFPGGPRRRPVRK